MKTSDISKRVGLGKFVTEMGAELKPWVPDLLPPEGRVVPLINIKPNPKTGTLILNGQQVIAYIRDQSRPRDSNRDDLYRFHVADCTTLQQMRRKDRYQRYVAATRRDGLFIVNFLGNYGDGPRENNVERCLYVCKNCLTRLNYKGYRTKSKNEQNDTRNSFDLIEFFEENTSQIKVVPTQTDISAPRNEYTLNWDQISRRYREKVGWMCERCSIDLRDNSEFLETHHIDGLRNNNGDKILWALCIGCHAEQSDHQHMKSTPRYREYEQWRESA